jgi:hypothetical protein
VFAPLRKSEALLSEPWVTRMSSSLDADEMTIDPVFVLNEDMGGVSNRHLATLVTECEPRLDRQEAPRRLDLADGRSYRLPPTRDVDSDSDYWLDNLDDVEAVLIERTGKNGLPEVVSDLREDTWSEVGTARGCGCQTAWTPLAGSLFVMLGALVLRRRRG